MKIILSLVAVMTLLTACNPPAGDSTTVVNPPADGGKKVENNTTVINPAAPAPKQEVKKESSTSVTAAPEGAVTEKTSTETKQ